MMMQASTCVLDALRTARVHLAVSGVSDHFAPFELSEASDEAAVQDYERKLLQRVHRDQVRKCPLARRVAHVL